MKWVTKREKISKMCYFCGRTGTWTWWDTCNKHSSDLQPAFHIPCHLDFTSSINCGQYQCGYEEFPNGPRVSCPPIIRYSVLIPCLCRNIYQPGDTMNGAPEQQQVVLCPLYSLTASTPGMQVLAATAGLKIFHRQPCFIYLQSPFLSSTDHGLLILCNSNSLRSQLL